MSKPNSIFAALLLLVAAAAPADSNDSALRALQRSNPDPSLLVAPAWREALSVMSAQQLDDLRAGMAPSSIVLDDGATLAAYMAARQLVDVPFALLVEPIGGGTSRGGAFLVDAAIIPAGAGVPNGSLTGGTLRLDPLLPGGGGTSSSAQFQLTASVGQPTVAQSHGKRKTLQPGFWAPSNADLIFQNGFE